MGEDDLTRCVNDPLWPILVETVHSMIMYKYHKTYVEEKILREKPEISPKELAARLGIPLGEALVILYELKGKVKDKSGN